MFIKEEMYLEMAKLTKKRANPIYGDIGEFIYFSKKNSSHGPRIKFYGGTADTSSTNDAPSMKFDKEGNTELELADWMTKKTCPNAFNKKYVANISKFIKTVYPILLLVWFDKLDESEALLYFQKHIPFSELLESIDFGDIDVDIEKIQTIEDLDTICKEYNLYR